MTLLPKQQLLDWLMSQGVMPMEGWYMPDRQYVLPEEQWFLTEHLYSTRQLFLQLGIEKGEPESGDCDDRAGGAAWWAGVLRRRTENHPPAALALGEFAYIMEENKRGHAICFAVVVDGNGKMKMIFWDATIFSRREPTQKEIESCTGFRL